MDGWDVPLAERRAETSSDDGLRGLRLCEAIVQSSRERRWVTVKANKVH